MVTTRNAKRSNLIPDLKNNINVPKKDGFTIFLSPSDKETYLDRYKIEHDAKDKDTVFHKSFNFVPTNIKTTQAHPSMKVKETFSSRVIALSEGAVNLTTDEKIQDVTIANLIVKEEKSRIRGPIFQYLVPNEDNDVSFASRKFPTRCGTSCPSQQ